MIHHGSPVMPETMVLEPGTRTLVDLDMAVAIARDFLEQLDRLDCTLLISTATGYCNGTVPGLVFEGDLGDQVDLVQFHCNVCMLGGLLLSKARVYDDTSVADAFSRSMDGLRIGTNRDRIDPQLLHAFDRPTLDCIESAFEADVMSEDYADGDEQARVDALCRGAVIWAEQLGDRRERARAIANEIIEGCGFFCPAGPVSEEDYRHWLNGAEP